MAKQKKPQSVTKPKTQICKEKEEKKVKCDNTQKLKLWQNSKSQIMTKLNNSNCDYLWQILKRDF